MSTELSQYHRQPPTASEFEGQHVHITRLDADRDVADLYAVSHEQEAYKSVWTYMWYGPFAGPQAMRDWLHSIQESRDPLYYAVTSRALDKTVGIVSILNIVPAMGRAELGHIWYGPVAQKTRVNTETIYLLLRYLFEELGYRRVEWKCDNANQESKRAAARLGFTPEGVFRQHMIVKGKNRDTAWFSILDSEWEAIRRNFETYLASDHLSLTELNRK